MDIALQPLVKPDQALQAELQIAANTDLLANMVRGIYYYPFLIVTLAATTNFRADHPALFWNCTGMLAASLAFRMVLSFLCPRIYSFNSWLWRWPVLISVGICSAACGVIYASVIGFYGFTSWPFTIVTIWLVGIAAGATTSFTPNFRLLIVLLTLTFGPALIMSLYMGGPHGHTIAFTTVCLCAFLLTLGSRLHKVYWAWLHQRKMEIARTRELETAKQTAESASIAKGRFLANMSHEIRTPMHGILGMANLAIESASPVEAREHMKVLSRSAEGLLRVLNDILDFSKIEAGKLSLESIPFSLRGVIAETRDILMPQASDKKITLECNVGPDIHDQLMGDPARLRQVLINLVGNAVKFTRVGSVTLAVTERIADQHEGYAELLFRVTDTGIGIPREQQELIFAPFSQADTSVTRYFGGTGLGLSICFQLVELMGGRLAVQSTPQAGSTFHFTSTFAHATEEIQVPQQAVPLVPIAHMRIMVAEDNLISQKLAATLLNRAGHSVTVVANGKDAVQVWEDQDFDLILMDNQMPEMDGMEAVRNIRDREAQTGRKRTHIVACSASAMAGDRERFLSAGMDSYLGKPFRPDELYAVIRDVACQPVS
jgi:signal transduction histidine kinase/ActR/RegA family two-component response regulator